MISGNKSDQMTDHTKNCIQITYWGSFKKRTVQIDPNHRSNHNFLIRIVIRIFPILRGTNLKNRGKNDQKTIFLGLWEDAMVRKSWDSKKAHLGILLNLHTKFQNPKLIAMEFMRWKTQKMRKTNQKTTFLRLWRGAMKLKSRDSKKTYLKRPLHIHTKFQFLSSIWWGDRGGTALF